MKKIIATLLILTLISMKFLETSGELLAKSNDSKSEEYVVTVQNEKNYKMIRNLYKDNIVEEYGTQEKQAVTLCMDLTENDVEQLCGKNENISVENNVGFVAAHEQQNENKKVQSENPDALNWNLQMIGVEDELNRKSNQVKVAVMDSGVDYVNDSNIIVKHINFVEEENYIPSYYEDVTGHGTAIAGIISEISANSEIYSVRVLNSQNKGKLDDIIKAIYWCIENDIQVINMSFVTSTKSTALETAIKAAADAGIIIVGASGNAGGAVQYPAAFDEVIAVGAVDSKANVTKTSNYGPELDFVAPGQQISTNGLFGGNIIVGGTSMAAAHVTGAVCRIMENKKIESPQFMKLLLEASTKNIGNQEKTGYGLVDIKYALNHFSQIRKEFEKAKQTGGECNNISGNKNQIEIFDEVDFVEGVWNADGHNAIVDDGESGAGNPSMATGCFSSTQLQVIKSACVAMDYGKYRDKFKDSNDKVFHGKYNYISLQDYLYKITRNIFTTGNDVTVTSICNKYSYEPDCQEYSDKSDSQVKKSVKEAVIFMASASGPLSEMSAEVKNVPWRQRRAFAVLGMLMHTLGDVYAHKTKVPNTIKIGTNRTETCIASGDMKVDWKVFSGKVNQSMMFNKLPNYVNNNYEDCSNFYPERISTAKRASNLVLRHFVVGSSKLDFGALLGEVTKRNTRGNVVQENKLAYFYRHVYNTYGKGRAESVKDVSFIPYDSEYGYSVVK